MSKQEATKNKPLFFLSLSIVGILLLVVFCLFIFPYAIEFLRIVIEEIKNI